MPTNFPIYETIIKRIRADVRSILTELDPTIYGSYIRAITDSNAGRHYDNVLTLEQIERQAFPTVDSPRETLIFWAAYEGLIIFEAKQSSGNAVFEGVVDSIINEDAEFRSADGNIYKADETVSVNNVVVAITSLTRSGSTVTAITGSNHNLATGNEPTIAGAVETDYNGTFGITVLSPTIFSYEITGTPATPATGTITVSCDCAVVPIISDDFGLALNLDSGATLTLLSPIIGVGNTGFSDATGFAGGQNEESNLSIYNRTIQSRGNPVANFNVAAIERAAFGVQGVTRVTVKRITPGVGDVTILFIRDDDDNIIPSGSEVAEVKTAIVELLQATSDEANVIVLAPTPVSTDYTFTSISPNTETMRTAIGKNIKAFYRDDLKIEQDITEDSYRNAIIDTIDPDTGDILSSFVLSAPTGTISVGTNSIGIPGSITF